MFQFTCPSRSTTGIIAHSQTRNGVSIHVPLAEHDEAILNLSETSTGFNSRAPRGARPSRGQRLTADTGFNSRAPRGARHDNFATLYFQTSFNSRAPRGARLRRCPQTPQKISFNSRAPRGARRG